jgi:hypothetical protein
MRFTEGGAKSLDFVVWIRCAAHTDVPILEERVVLFQVVGKIGDPVEQQMPLLFGEFPPIGMDWRRSD